MLKMYIDNEEVVSKNDFTIKEEMLSASSTILNNTYPKSWEQDKDYISRFYYPKDYSKLILNKDTYYPHIDGETIEGSNFQIQADTTLEDDYYFKGNTYQETTTGTNLLDTRDGTTLTNNQVTFTPTYNSKGELESINVNGTASAMATYQFPNYVTLKAGTYYISKGGTNNVYMLIVDSGGSSYVTTKDSESSFTLSADKSVKLYLRVYSGTSINNAILYPMVATTSGATYEPYTNGASPNPDYPQPIQVATGRQEIEVCGKNLFDGTKVSTTHTSNWGISFENNILTIQHKNTYTTGTPEINVGVLPSGTYVFSGTLGGSVGLYINDTYNKMLSSGTTFTCDGTQKISIKFTNNSATTLTYTNVMLDKSSTATTYEPYIGNKYEINLGKNLAQFSGSGTLRGIPWSVENNVFKVNGTTTSSGGSNTYFSPFKTESGVATYWIEVSGYTDKTSGNAFMILQESVDNSTWTNTYQAGLYSSATKQSTVNLSSSKYYRIRFYAEANTTFTNAEVKVQLEMGTQKTSFSPYFTPIELCKINDYKDSIKKSEGKNLFDKDNFTEISASINATQVSASANPRTIYIPITGGKTYTIQKRLGSRFRVATTNVIPTDGVSTSGFINGDSQSSITITTDTNANYLCIYYFLYGTDTLTQQQLLDSIMVNEGTTPLPYEPYLAKGKWYIEKNIGKVVLDGSETGWALYNAIGSQPRRFGLYQSKWYKDSISILSNYFIGDLVASQVDLSIWTQINYLGITDKNSYWASANDLKTWLGTHNTIVYYVLATPTYTEITNEELISQLNSIELLDGLNNISITSANLSMIMNLHYNYQTEHTDSELIFSGMVKNTNNISLNPREPKYCSLEILDYKTLLSEGKTLDYVISNKTILEAIEMVVNSISEYGFELGNVNILNGNEIIGAYSTENKTAYDVLQYLADISSAKWNCRRKDNTNMYIDFYDPTLMPRGKQIEYTNEWACENNLCDIKFNYGTRDYRNKQIILSDEVEGSIEYNDRVVSDGINKEYTLPYKIASLNKIEIDGVEQSIATKEEKEVGIYADFYYSRNNDTFTSNKTLPYGTLIDVSYTPIIKGREVVQNDSEIDRLTNQLEVNGTISRYENRNDTTDSNKLINIGETYLKYKGEAEITLTIKTENNNLYNVGQIVYFNAPIPELQKDYLVKSKQIQVISSDENELNIFYTFTLSSSFNAEKEINWFDNQRAKTEGNIGEGEFISRNIDINSRANIIWDNLRVEEVDLPVGASNDLQATLESPLIH